ncbi:MAG TPA: helix-turn-helix domain-containing protein [Polyangiaceae bacterium]|nr:helix-turn-helix domain-containing protein [Polyangiaceae bacterium]
MADTDERARGKMQGVANSAPLLDEPAESGEFDGQAPELDLRATVGRNLRRLRLQRGLSLERLARASGVSRAMLGQIELGQSTPTITILWKIARALDLSFVSLLTPSASNQAVLLRRDESRVLASSSGDFQSRALFPRERHPQTEFYELLLRPGVNERQPAHPAGTAANLVVARGRVTVLLGGKRHDLEAGDALVFAADVEHELFNSEASEAQLFLVLVFPRTT